MFATIPKAAAVGPPPKRTCDIGSHGATAYATGRLMGTDCQVRATCATASDALAAVDVGWQEVAECDQLWSRFIADSELTCLNESAEVAPSTVVVSHLTAALIAAMLWAYDYSAGWVDASLLPQVIQAGYDRDFAELDSAGESTAGLSNGVSTGRSPGMSTVSLDGNLLSRSAPVFLDSGGVGKGLAADLVASAIMRAGAVGALVDLGGDIRAIGCDQHGRSWKVRAADERDPRQLPLADWNVQDAGIATSSIARRRWRGGHHLIDPHTGTPSHTDLLAVTVVGKNALTAEVAAKTALLMGLDDGIEWLRDHVGAAVLTGVDGTITRDFSVT